MTTSAARRYLRTDVRRKIRAYTAPVARWLLLSSLYFVNWASFYSDDVGACVYNIYFNLYERKLFDKNSKRKGGVRNLVDAFGGAVIDLRDT